MTLTGFERELLYLVLWIIASGIVSTLVALLWRRVVIPICQKTRLRLDAALAEAVDGPLQWVVLSAGVYFGASLAFAGPEGGAMYAYRTHQVWRLFMGVFYVNLVLSCTLLVYSLCKGMVDWYAQSFAERTRSELDNQAVVLFERFAKIAFLLIALTIVFKRFEISIAGILAAGSIASLAVAFAARDTLANMISGIILMIDRPFKRGDRIVLPSGDWGDVVEIGLRTTKVLSYTQHVIVIPNAEIAKSQIVNQSAPNQQVKVEHRVGVAYGSDMRKVKDIILGVLRQHPDIMDDPPQQVFFMEFGDSALELLSFFWIADCRERYRILDEVNMAINDRFAEEDIEVPFPQRDIWMRSAAPVMTGPPPAPRSNTSKTATEEPLGGRL